MGVDACADRGAAERHLFQQGEGFLETLTAAAPPCGRNPENSWPRRIGVASCK